MQMFNFSSEKKELFQTLISTLNYISKQQVVWNYFPFLSDDCKQQQLQPAFILFSLTY